jgi:hypothetical protein
MGVDRRIRLHLSALSLAVVLAACTSGAATSGGETERASSLASTAAATPTARTPAPRASATTAQRTRHTTPKATASRIPAHVDGTGVFGIGDSIMVDATSRLQSDLPGIQLDAQVGRQVPPGVTILQNLAAAGRVPDATVFGLGTNGPFLSSQLTELVQLTAGHRLVVVTTHCPYCSWTHADNSMVRAECTARRHCYIAHFQAAARRHPEWFFSDGVHLPSVGAGAKAYAHIVTATLCAAGGC